ncbi:MAG: lipopolysaccharide biosynthesis protein [Candidatus Krumholzibacteria bacterium]|nr:lipopolysaccharide biosynthesis protein [Candidatus Krumholzibacteria bacterium]
MTRPSMRHNFSWTFAGNLVYAASLWVILSLLTKVGDTGTVGRFSLASVIATPIVMFGNLQLRALLTTDVRGDYTLSDYVGLRLLALPVALVVVVVVAVLGYSGDQILVIGLFGLARVVESCSDILYGYAQKRERLDLVARSMIIKGIVTVVVVGGTYVATLSLPAAMSALVAAWLVPLLAYDLPQCRKLTGELVGDSLRPAWRWPNLRSLVWTALPMGVVMLLIQLRNTIPRTILEAHYSENELGIFAALAYLVIVGTTVTLALAQSSLARLSVYYAEGQAGPFRRTVGKLVLIGVGLGVAAVLVAWLLGAPILNLIYEEEYGDHADLLVLIMAAGGVLFVANLLGAPATATRNFRGQMVVHLINVGVLYGLGTTLIPRLGMIGTAWTMLGGALWVTVGYAGLVWYGYRRLVSTTGAEVTS